MRVMNAGFQPQNSGAFYKQILHGMNEEQRSRFMEQACGGEADKGALETIERSVRWLIDRECTLN